jgi:hypothetical protein
MRLIALLVAPLAAAVVAAASAYAEPAESAHAEAATTTSPSYQMGYTKALADVQLAASRMRAEGFDLADIDISSRIPTLCAKESASVQAVPGFSGADFVRGCADGMKSLVQAGIAS